jgi:YqaJ-like viral recombinase domain
MSFTAVQRAGYLGASDAGYWMNPVSDAVLLHWWEVKVGIREPDPPTWAMMAGSLLGDAIVDYYEFQTGDAITRRQESVASPTNNRFRSTLDGWSASRKAVIEAKFASPFFDREAIFATYYPQVAFQMHCTDAEGGFLVIAQGTNDPIEIECIRDADYEKVLLERAAAMLESIDTLSPPVHIEPPTVVPPEKWRTVDLAVDDPNWADELISLLSVYDLTQQGHDQHENAGQLARALVPDDVGKVLTGHYTLSRNKKGTVSINRRKAA